jgi:methionyl-tRNA formyltransferase
MIRIWFFGTPYLARRVLEDIFASSDFEVVFAVTNPDKPFGRSWEMRASAVKDLALEKNIPLLQPLRIRENKEFLDELRTYNCDYFVVVAYWKILPKELLEIPKKMCINVHGSILPKYRWASPIQAALLHGERETGVTIMEMSEGMDEGDILKIRGIPISDDETSETLFEKFAEISWPTLLQTLRELEMWGITPLPQYHEKATYCKKIEKEDGLVDWSLSARDIYHMWQAYTPWPGIYTMYEGKRLLLENVSVYRHSDEGRIHVSGLLDPSHAQDDETIGKVIKLENGSIGVVSGEWILTLEQVKLERKKPKNIYDFVNGNQKFISSVL